MTSSCLYLWTLGILLFPRVPVILGGKTWNLRPHLLEGGSLHYRANGYQIRHWHSGLDQCGDRLVLRDRRGRMVIDVRDYGINAEFYQDITGDGVPELCFHSWTGGAHASLRYYVYSLGRIPRNLVTYDKGNGGDYDDFVPQDLDGDGDKEIVTWDDSFAYHYGSYGCSPRLPVILGLKRGRYVDVTRFYRPLLWRYLHQRFVNLSRPGWLAWYGCGSDFTTAGPFVEAIYLAELLGKKDGVIHKLNLMLPKKQKITAAVLGDMETVMRGRYKKLRYLRSHGVVVKCPSEDGSSSRHEKG